MPTRRYQSPPSRAAAPLLLVLTVLLSDRVGRGQAAMVPREPWPPSQMVVLAKATSAEHIADKESPRWVFNVDRTLRGTDISGDTIGVQGEAGKYKLGWSYLIYFQPGGEAVSVDRSVEATEDAIKEAEAAVVKAGGKVEPKLQLWGVGGAGQRFLWFGVRVDGSMSYQFWDGEHRGRDKLMLSYDAKLSKEQIADLAHRIAEAPAEQGPPDLSYRGVGWRDVQNVPHNETQRSDPTKVWASIEDCVVESKGEWRQTDVNVSPTLAEVKEDVAKRYAERHLTTRPAVQAVPRPAEGP